jgi:Winged helix DNA-binding domain
LTRNEVYDALERAGIAAHLKTPVGSRGMHIIGIWPWKVSFVSARDEANTTFVLLDEWVPSPRHLSREEALAELAGRYFRSRGPATEHDFAWWSGLPVLDARASIDIVRPPLAKAKFAGNAYWFAGAVPTVMRSSGVAHLLPYVDEYTVAYKDRSALADPELMIRINAASPVGILGPIIVINGRIVGIWKRTIEKKEAGDINQSFHSKRPESHCRGRRALWYLRWAAGCRGRIINTCSRPLRRPLAPVDPVVMP